MLKKILFILFQICIAGQLIVQAQQISIPRIEVMPNLPQPYEMRDWKAVAQAYDSLVFNLDATGEYMPLTTIVENTDNYPTHPAFGIQSYVGGGLPGMEAINVLPAIVGATLSGIDKSDNHGYNWALLCEEYFNRVSGENIYLNNPNTSTGNDWWYETMPNVFFYQLNYLYPHTGNYDYQFISVANRWLQAVQAMGGSETPWQAPYMNYRAFNLLTMTPLEIGVKQPEAAGAIAWILYNAYTLTGEKKYRKGAEWCMEFLNNWNQNPSYELQLPYGVYAAARMNAELGTDYDIEKMLNWCFDVGDLRGWGCIVGNWNGNDVSGLIGEARDGNPGYAFNMNGFEQVGALVPMLRYDDRFARAIGKWVLNAANASRLFYSAYLSGEMQDNEVWASQYDPESVIAYEAIKQETTGAYGTGDAMRNEWAETTLGLYGSSHVGIFGGIIEKTNVDGILKLDMLATDYYRQEAYPTYLYFNPYQNDTTITITLPEGNHSIYDAVSNQFIQNSVSGATNIIVPADAAVMAVYIPENPVIEYELKKTLANGIVIDYNNGQEITNHTPRIKSLSITDSVALINSTTTIYCAAEDKEPEQLTYQWHIDGVLQTGENSTLEWLAPGQAGYYKVICNVTDGGGISVQDTLKIKVVEKINYHPEIEQMEADPGVVLIDEISQLSCTASDQNEDELTYLWSAQKGTINGTGNVVSYRAPDEQGNYTIYCQVTDTEGASKTDSLIILVRDTELEQAGELVARYEFQENANDYSDFAHHGSISNCSFTANRNGQAEQAVLFNQANSIITVQNTNELNFTEGITVCFWMNISQFYDRESYLISHGSWENRWKISIVDKHLRFTLKGENGIIDLDTKTELKANTWYHIVALYNGWDCEIYINGEPDIVDSYNGQLLTTSYDLIFGQSLPGQSGYNYNGIVDDARIYNYGIAYPQIIEIYEQEPVGVNELDRSVATFKVFPNPARQIIHISAKTEAGKIVTLSLKNILGHQLFKTAIIADLEGNIKSDLDVSEIAKGIYIIQLTWDNKSFARKVIFQ